MRYFGEFSQHPWSYARVVVCERLEDQPPCSPIDSEGTLAVRVNTARYMQPKIGSTPLLKKNETIKHSKMKGFVACSVVDTVTVAGRSPCM